MKKTKIGFLTVGDTFYLDGIRYRAGHLVSYAEGYVSCVNTETKKVTRLYIDTTVEIEQKGE